MLGPVSGGVGGTVEVDDSFVGGNEPGVRGRLSKTKAKAKVIIAIESAGKLRPYGAKGAGESGILAVSPPVAAAVRDATGVRIRYLPLTPERVRRELQAREG
jgi:hypothetical protein